MLTNFHPKFRPLSLLRLFARQEFFGFVGPLGPKMELAISIVVWYLMTFVAFGVLELQLLCFERNTLIQ